jgi:glyoxylase-like metal-dependent hydrolase (beta-lactamase superfamily II)
VREVAVGDVTRRRLFRDAALATVALTSPAARAAAPLAEKQGVGVYRLNVGSCQLSALYDGIWYRKIDATFVRNATPAQVDKALAEKFLPPRVVPTSFTPLLVNTGRRLILIDAGTGGQIAPSAGLLPEALAAAGIRAEAIDEILITHFHPDHISGLKDKDGRKTFPNAEIVVPAPEWAYWMDDARLSGTPEAMRPMFLNARRIFADLAAEVRRFTPGTVLGSGIVTVPAFGHTPGHTAYLVASGGKSVLVLGDTVTHPWLFARYPHWQGSFDIDGKMAVETRQRLLDRAAADRMLVHGYHFPFPASAYVRKRRTGYDVVPPMWQPL